MAICRSACLLGCLASGLGSAPPTLKEVRALMGLPSQNDVRGQKDTVGFASTAVQMAKVWALSAAAPEPETFGQPAAPGVPGVLCPHDDYVYAGRVYRKVLPLVTAKTVILVGVFHAWKRFEARDGVVLDTYRAWRAPDGEIPVSSLRAALLEGLPKGEVIQDAAMHDMEHSLEAVAYWLKHLRSDVEILPMLVPAASFQRFQHLADHVGHTLAAAMAKQGLALGKDVAVVISSDGVHYGADFSHIPFGEGGVDAYTKARQRERDILKGPLSGPVSDAKAKVFYETCVDPADPGTYRVTWCGRYAVPFGLMLLERLAHAQGRPAPMGRPQALSITVDVPELPVKPLGMGATAPANLYHFVGIPGVTFGW